MAGDMQHPGEVRDTFAALIHEIDLLAAAMGITFEVDIVRTNLEILDTLSPEASTSMQRDIMQGKQSEIDGLVFEVLRMANKFGVSLPNYEKIALNLKKTLDNCV
jgi:2-dehydropantoate 2-reductase